VWLADLYEARVCFASPGYLLNKNHHVMETRDQLCACGRPKNPIFASQARPNIRITGAIDIEIVADANNALVQDRPTQDGALWCEAMALVAFSMVRLFSRGLPAGRLRIDSASARLRALLHVAGLLDNVDGGTERIPLSSSRRASSPAGHTEAGRDR
jgi:hypothetical protein